MIKKILLSSFIIGLLNANSIIEDKQFELVQSIIPGTKIEKVKPSVISGMYEAYFIDGSLMYVIPDKRLLIMGEIYTNTGQSLTQKSISEYKSANNIKDPLEQSIDELKINSLENKKYLKELFETGIKVGKNVEQKKYNIVLFKSLTCPYCKKLDEYLKDKDLKLSIYLAPGKDSEDFYISKYNIQDAGTKLKEQLELVNKKIKGFGVPFALIIDKNYDLIDTIHGFDDKKWDKYINEN